MKSEFHRQQQFALEQAAREAERANAIKQRQAAVDAQKERAFLPSFSASHILTASMMTGSNPLDKELKYVCNRLCILSVTTQSFLPTCTICPLPLILAS